MYNDPKSRVEERVSYLIFETQPPRTPEPDPAAPLTRLHLVKNLTKTISRILRPAAACEPRNIPHGIRRIHTDHSLNTLLLTMWQDSDSTLAQTRAHLACGSERRHPGLRGTLRNALDDAKTTDGTL